MKNGTIWKFITAILASILTTFVVMWITLGANSASQADLKGVVIELRAENACLELRINQRLDRLANIGETNMRAIGELTGYMKAEKDIKDK
jgi:hypothetical protein